MTSASTKSSPALCYEPFPAGDVARDEGTWAMPAECDAHRVLRDLADRELPLIAQLELAERRLAERLLARIDDSREAAALARTLREVVGVTTDLARRLQGLLVAGAALEAQAAVVRAHRGRLAADPGGAGR